MDLLMMSLEAK